MFFFTQVSLPWTTPHLKHHVQSQHNSQIYSISVQFSRPWQSAFRQPRFCNANRIDTLTFSNSLSLTFSCVKTKEAGAGDMSSASNPSNAKMQTDRCERRVLATAFAQTRVRFMPLSAAADACSPHPQPFRKKHNVEAKCSSLRTPSNPSIPSIRKHYHHTVSQWLNYCW